MTDEALHSSLSAALSSSMLNLLLFPVLAKATSFQMSKGVLRIEAVSISVDSDSIARDIFEDLTPFFNACFMVLLPPFKFFLPY